MSICPKYQNRCKSVCEFPEKNIIIYVKNLHLSAEKIKSKLRGEFGEIRLRFLIHALSLKKLNELIS